MALSLIDKLQQQARTASQDDVNKICSAIEGLFYEADKAGDCMALLRQLFFILQASAPTSSLSPPRDFIMMLVNTVATPDKGRLKECLLCRRILLELLPLDGEVVGETAKLQDKIPSTIHLQINEGRETGCIDKMLPTAVRWLQAQDMEFEAQRKVFSFLVAVSILHSHSLDADCVRGVNDRMGGWLMDVGLYQAANPFTSTLFKRDQTSLVTEVDGTASTNFFTVLNIGKFYTDEQLLNIYSFSILYQWLAHTRAVFPHPDPQPDVADVTRAGHASPRPRHSPRSNPVPVLAQRPLTPREQMTRSLSSEKMSRSMSSEHLTLSRSPSGQQLDATPPKRSPTPSSLQKQFSLRRQNEVPILRSRPTTPQMDRQASSTDKPTIDGTRRVFDSLVGRSLDYCFRILDQCERKPKVASDIDLQNACLIETVKLLDLICTIDRSHVPKAFMELKRLSSQTSQEANNPRILLVILQFLMHHCAAVAYDPHEEFNSMFHRVVSRNYNSHTIAFEIVLFILDNLEELCFDYQILTTYFPNILKILAWNPRTFVTEFTDIVPVMMSPTTSIEILHTLIDLPCMTAALEVIDRFKNVDLSTVTPVASDLDPTCSSDAFKNAQFRPMFNFFTRAEGGHGDTINRLDSFHTALGDMADSPRVVVCCQVVPVLLREWFGVIVEEGSRDFVSHLLPVLLERTACIYGIPEYKADVKRIISENLVLLLKKFPEVVLGQRSEVMDFLSSTRNIEGREDFYCNLVWSVGEFSSVVYDRDLAADTVVRIYEVLEVVLYEAIGVTATTRAHHAPYTIKVVSTLMSAIAKLATRCQDLIPRAILCLTKVAKQHGPAPEAGDQREVLLSRAQELTNLLKLPNFASVILNPSHSLEKPRVHRDSTSMAAILRGTYRLVAPNL